MRNLCPGNWHRRLYCCAPSPREGSREESLKPHSLGGGGLCSPLGLGEGERPIPGGGPGEGSTLSLLHILSQARARAQGSSAAPRKLT